MQTPRAVETRAGGPRGHAHGTSLCVRPCVSMCVYVCDAICSQFPLTNKSQEALAPKHCPGCSGLCGVGRRADGGAELSPNLVEAMGQRSGWRDQAVPL